MREIEFAGRIRGFCPDCGTTLTFRSSPGSDEVDVTVSSLDNPESVTPADHIWIDDRLSWIKLADNLPTHPTGRPQNRA